MAAANQPDDDASDADAVGGSSLRVSSEQHDAVTVLDVAGEIDQLSAPKLERAIADILQHPPRC